MANQQIPNLPPVIALAGTEQLEAVQAGTSVKVNVDQLGEYISTAYPPSSLGNLTLTGNLTVDGEASVGTALTVGTTLTVAGVEIPPLRPGCAIARTVSGQLLYSESLTSNLFRIKDATDDGSGHVLIESFGEHGLQSGNTVNVRIDGVNGISQLEHPGNGDALLVTYLTDTTFSLDTTTWAADSVFQSGFFWSTTTEIVNARTELTNLITLVHAEGGGTIYLPSGVLVLRKLVPASGPGLLLREGVSLIGRGYNTTTLFAYDELNGHTVQSAGEGNLTFSQMTVYGNRQRQAVAGYHGIRFGADNVQTSNVILDARVEAAAGYGVGLQSTNSSYRGFRINLYVNGSDSDGIDVKNRADGNEDNEINAYVKNFGLFRVGITTAPYSLPNNPFTTASGNQNVVVSHTSNGFSVGVVITYPNGGTFNGIDLTGSFEVVAKTGTTYTIATGQTASASGTGGGAGVLEYNAQWSVGDAGIDIRGKGWLVSGRVESDLRGRTGIRFRAGQTLGSNPGASYSVLSSGFVSNTGLDRQGNGVSVGFDGNNINNLLIENVSQGIQCYASSSDNNFSNIQFLDCQVGLLARGTNNGFMNIMSQTCGTGIRVEGGDVTDAEFLGDNPFTVTSGSPVVSVDAPGHGQITGDLVTIADAVADFGIDFDATDRPITVVDANTFTYDPQSGNATGSGTAGGENAYYSFGTVASGVYLQISNVRTSGCDLGIDILPSVTGIQVIGHNSDGDIVAMNDQGGGSYILPPLTTDPDVTVWAAEVLAQGGTVTAAELIPINAFVLSEKAAGVYDLMDDYFPLGWTSDATAGLISFKKLRLGVAVNSPVFTAYRGYAGDGVSAYINSDFAPNVRCTAATGGNVRVSGYVLSGNTGATSILGASSTASIRLRPSSGAAVGAQVCAALAGFPDVITTVEGYTAAQRAGTTTMSGQRDATALTDVIVASTSANLPTDVIALLARNNGGVITEFFDGELFMAGIGAPLTLAQGQAQNDNIVALLAAVTP